MTADRGESRAVERVTAELRQAPGPDLDWDRVERKLFERVDADERARRRTGSARIVAALAAAAALLLVIGSVLRSPPQQSASAPAVGAAPSRVFGPGVERVAGAALAAGDRVVAGAAHLTVEHPGRGTWTLEPSSEATVVGTGKVITLRLSAGAVLAKVVPSSEPETFVVEVERVRVAVHGTTFRVARSGEGVEVAVTEGVVAVGAQGERPTFFLHAGDSGTFSGDGTRGDVKRATKPADPAAPPAAPKVASPVRPALPTAPSPADVAKALDRLSAAVTSCFDTASAKGEVRVQVRTTLSASFDADGNVSSLVLDPPLAPAVTECVQRAAPTVRVPQSTQGGSGQRDLFLGT